MDGQFPRIERDMQAGIRGNHVYHVGSRTAVWDELHNGLHILWLYLLMCVFSLLVNGTIYSARGLAAAWQTVQFTGTTIVEETCKEWGAEVLSS